MSNSKTVLLCVTGGIAAFKAASVASGLVKKGYRVETILTEHACEFITPLTFEAITHTRCHTGMFDQEFTGEVEHIFLATNADAVLVAPATANVIAKLAHGIADDMLTSTILACTCPKIIAPAMNTNMLNNPVTQDNLITLEHYGWTVIPSAEGRLACGTTGSGKLPEPDVLIDYVEQEIECEKDMLGKKVLVTAGPTQESLDPVRYLTNHSSGKMGYAIAEAAARRGADVTLVSGPTALEPPRFVDFVPIVSAQDMYDAVTSLAPEQDIIIKAAAVADYRPATVADNKIKKKDDDLSIPLARTQDILKYLGEHRREGQFLCGFSMETENMVENSRKKLLGKHLDMIAANNVKVAGAGFAVDTNILTLITADKEYELPLLSKKEAAMRLLDAILE